MAFSPESAPALAPTPAKPKVPRSKLVLLACSCVVVAIIVRLPVFSSFAAELKVLVLIILALVALGVALLIRLKRLIMLRRLFALLFLSCALVAFMQVMLLLHCRGFAPAVALAIANIFLLEYNWRHTRGLIRMVESLAEDPWGGRFRKFMALARENVAHWKKP